MLRCNDWRYWWKRTVTEDRKNVDVSFWNTYGARQSAYITVCLRKVDAARNSDDWTGSKHYVKNNTSGKANIIVAYLLITI